MIEQNANNIAMLQSEMQKAHDDEQAKVAFFLENTNPQVLMTVLNNMQPKQRGQWGYTGSSNSSATMVRDLAGPL